MALWGATRSRGLIMNNAANVQKFIAKMEQLDKIIENQDNGITSNFLIGKEEYNAGLSITESPATSSNNKFTMFIDRWGTSTRRVGP